MSLRPALLALLLLGWLPSRALAQGEPTPFWMPTEAEPPPKKKAKEKPRKSDEPEPGASVYVAPGDDDAPPRKKGQKPPKKQAPPKPEKKAQKSPVKKVEKPSKRAAPPEDVEPAPPPRNSKHEPLPAFPHLDPDEPARAPAPARPAREAEPARRARPLEPPPAPEPEPVRRPQRPKKEVFDPEEETVSAPAKPPEKAPRPPPPQDPPAPEPRKPPKVDAPPPARIREPEPVRAPEPAREPPAPAREAERPRGRTLPPLPGIEPERPSAAPLVPEPAPLPPAETRLRPERIAEIREPPATEPPPEEEYVPVPLRWKRSLTILALGGMWQKPQGDGRAFEPGYGLQVGWALAPWLLLDLTILRSGSTQGSGFASTSLTHSLFAARLWAAWNKGMFSAIGGLGFGGALSQTVYSIQDVNQPATTLPATALKTVLSGGVGGRARPWRGLEVRVEVNTLLRDGRIEPLLIVGAGWAF